MFPRIPVGFAAILSLFFVQQVREICAADSPPRPNILWITSEDNGPELGCYGDAFADTPNIDRLAARGLIYLNAWSNAPVCAPARTTIISGMYPPSTGSEHMRSLVSLPEGFRMFPQYLREAGYYCTNNSKEDYNLQKPDQVWDNSFRLAHWKSRKPGQPFFAVFNIGVSHESRIRKRPHKQIHDPAKVPLPAYHPDAPEVRQDWAQYYDKVTEMDRRVGRHLQELQDAGLQDDTIIFYYGDHGSGMPRSKRWLYQSGLRVPLVVYVPEKFCRLAPDDYQTGGESNRLVSFVDLAPTVLSLAGIKPPENFQGHAWMGKYRTPAPQYMYGFRGRMDARIDLSRCLRDERYLYIRNYMPHKPRGQYLSYMFKTPTTRVWKALYDQGKLSPPKTYFWEPKPPEELYDLTKDRDQVNNLANSAEHRQILDRLRKANRNHLLAIRDIGFLPEAEMLAQCSERTPYDLGHDDAAYPLARVLDTAEMASSQNNDDTKQLTGLLSDSNAAVRYWAALGLLMRGQSAVPSARDQLNECLHRDESPSVRIVSAEALAKFGSEGDRDAALATLVDLADVSQQPTQVAVAALGSLDDLDEKALPAINRIRALPTEPPTKSSRYNDYIALIIKHTLADLNAGSSIEK
ncbi:MAG: sulfatase-like hydrolase/transferase [Planctomycetes bacterium]|nr:sulfatase-like hydrolase/transferase [Planctomycetota bacterium]